MLHARIEPDGLSDTRFLQRFKWHLPLGDLLADMRSALQFCALARDVARASGTERDYGTWRFYAREVHAIADAMRRLYGVDVTLPSGVEVPL